MTDSLTPSLAQQQIVAVARTWLATPYHHQASAKSVGCDCLGLVRGIWRETIGEEPCATPQYSSDWGEVGSNETLLEVANRYFIKVTHRPPQLADLLLFRWHEGAIIKHLGIMSAPDKFIHAYEKTGVVESPLVAGWSKRIAAIYSFPGIKK